VSTNLLVIAAQPLAERLAGTLPPGTACLAIAADAEGDPLAGLGAALQAADAVVVCLDGLPGRLPALIEAARAGFEGRSAVVRSRPWNGTPPLPLARPCTAVIAGFGDAAAAAAAVARWWSGRGSAREG